MTRRIVDEAFVNQLESNSASEVNERFSHIQKKIEALEVNLSLEKTSGLTGFVARIVIRILQPVINQFVTDQKQILLDLKSTTEDHLKKQASDINQIQENVRKVYLKTGESLAALRDDILNHIDTIVNSLPATQTNQDQVNLEKYESDFKRLGSDVIARSEILLRHVQDRLDAIEYDAARNQQRSEAVLKEYQLQLENVKSHVSTLTSVKIASEHVSRPQPKEAPIQLTQDKSQIVHSVSKLKTDNFEIYLEYVKQQKRIIDLNAGNGDLIAQAARNGIEIIGLVRSQKQLDQCDNSNINVEISEPYDYLQQIDKESVGAILFTDGLEEYAYDQILELIQLAYSVLEKNGVLILEALNPNSLFALSQQFHLNPRNKNLFDFNVLKATCEKTGFSTVNSVKLSREPMGQRLKLVDPGAVVPAAIDRALDQINSDIEQLNDMLYGNCRYAIIAVK